MENYDSEGHFKAEHYLGQIVDAVESLQKTVFITVCVLAGFFVLAPALFPQFLPMNNNLASQKGIVFYCSWAILACLTACALSAPVRKSIQQTSGSMGKKRIPNFQQVKKDLSWPEDGFKWVEFLSWAFAQILLCSLAPIPIFVIASMV